MEIVRSSMVHPLNALKLAKFIARQNRHYWKSKGLPRVKAVQGIKVVWTDINDPAVHKYRIVYAGGIERDIIDLGHNTLNHFVTEYLKFMGILKPFNGKYGFKEYAELEGEWELDSNNMFTKFYWTKITSPLSITNWRS